MEVQDTVSDDEDIYRRVRNNKDLFQVVNGAPRFSSSAFNDPGQKPSVDRARLRGSPEEAKAGPSDGIISLRVTEVRAITSVKNDDAKADEPSVYGVDVVPRPVLAGNAEGLPENLAHAQIETNPGLKSTGRFKKLKEALALIATQRGWLLAPTSPEGEQNPS